MGAYFAFFIYLMITVAIPLDHEQEAREAKLCKDKSFFDNNYRICRYYGDPSP